VQIIQVGAAQVSEQIPTVVRQELVELRKYAPNQDFSGGVVIPDAQSVFGWLELLMIFAGAINLADAQNLPAYLELLVRAELVETTAA
jgi:hypothetical protein